MTHFLSRRQFHGATAAALGQYWLTGQSLVKGQDSPLDQQQLVRLGINALARAPEMNYFADGHRGAAMISAHLMCQDNQLDDQAAKRMAELFDLNWAKTKLCESFPEGDPVDNAIDLVGEALADGKGVLREVGHDAIFAMHAIKAFTLLPETATRERVQGVQSLIQKIKPWRDIQPDEAVQPPPFSDSQAASRYILNEASDAIDRFIGFGQGFAGHMLTFGQSLVEMAAMGHEEWAEGCRTAFRKYVTVTRLGPQPDDRKIKEHAVTALRPTDTQYWEKRGDKSLGLGHVFKYPYAYYDLLHRADSPELAKKFNDKAWRLF
jgi:hypothetical protein